MPTPEQLYLRSPRHIQTVLANAAAAKAWKGRYGPNFNALLQEYEGRDQWSRAELDAFADAQRALQLARAARTPYYQQIFQDMGAHWTELIPVESFAQIPITQKQQYRDQADAFRPRPRQASDQLTRTSGTTGVPTEVLKTALAVEEQWAVWWRYRRWHGIGLETPCALFAGRRIMSDQQGAPFWRQNYVGRETRFSTYHISRQSAPEYVAALNAGKFTWVHGFSSAIANLARFIVEDDLQVSAPIVAVTLGGENLLPWQHDVIADAFGPRPVHHYGLTEQAANASVCPQGSLHVDEDFSFVELVGDDPDGRRRIVGTPYTNAATTLLRYDTGDVTRSQDGDCSCGRASFRLNGIDGRGDETLELPDGRQVGPRRAFRADLGLAEVQIVQHPDLSLTIRFVPGPRWMPGHDRRLEAAVREFVGPDLPIRCESVASIPKTAGGKLRLVVREPLPA